MGTLLVHVDPHLPCIPQALVNFVLHFLGPFGLQAVCKVRACYKSQASGNLIASRFLFPVSRV